MQGFGEPLLAQEDIDTLFAPLEPPSSVVYSAQGPLPLSAANLERNNDSNAPKADHSHVLTTHPQQLTPRTPLPTSPPSPLSGSPSALRMSATQARALLTAGPYTRKNGAQTVEVTGDVVHFFDTETAAPLPPARVLCVTERVSEDSNDGSVGPSLISGTPIENIGKERRFGRMLLAPQQPSYQPYAPPLESRARTEITLLGVSLLDLNANEAVWADGDCWAAVNPPDVMTPIDSHLNMTVRYAQNLTSPPPIEEMEDEERGRAMSKNTTTASLPSVPAAPTASMQAMLSAEHIPLWRRLFCCAVDLSKAYNSSDPEEEVDYTLPFAVRLIAMVQSTLECYLSGTANDDSYWSEQSCAELVVMLVLAMRRECSFAHPGHCIDIVMYCASRLQATPASLPKVIQQLRRAHASTDPQINGGARSNVDIISHWWAVDKDGSGLLDFAELRELMSRLNSSISVAKLREKLRNFDLDGNNELDFFEFVRFYYALQRREGIAQQVEKVHAQYFGDSNTQGLQHGMRRFLEEVQKEDGANSTTTQNELEMWFGRFAPLPASWERYNFVRYLCSAGNTWNDPAHNAFRKEDMDYPLSAYYINSSHNTYLTGDQLTSVSSVHMYQRALADGGRCIEIDVCAEGGRLMVKHVNTPTMPIRFVDVLNTVRQFAFAKSKYPVIISLENRVDSKRDQEEMARQLKAVLGTALYVKKLDGCDYTHSSFTAHALRGRFLLRSKANCCRALLDLISFTTGPVDANQDLAKRLSVGKCQSCDNTKARKWARTKGSYVKKLTTKRLVRVYPMGSYALSQNFAPAQIWAGGFQMCALNIQTLDPHMAVNRAMFRQNGGMGYVLKPRHLREMEYTPRRRSLSLFMVGGGNLPKPRNETSDILDPYVEVRIVGAEEDCTATPARTPTVIDNGLDPVWRTQFDFHVSTPECAFVVVTVFDKEVVGRDRIAALAVCPFPCIRQGFRSIPLESLDGTPYDTAFLLAQIRVGE